MAQFSPSAWASEGLRVPPGDQQSGLALSFDAGSLKARLCAAARCADSVIDLARLPKEATAKLTEAKFSTYEVAPGRRVAHVRVPTANAAQWWEAVVAAPISGSSPLLLFSGLTGPSLGEPGERTGSSVSVIGNNVVIGEQREDVSICGRPVLIKAQLIGADLKLHPAKVQQLTASEREQAVSLTPVMLADPAETAMPPWSPLKGFLASSAIGSPSALTDGDLTTFWSEQRGADGRGEFVLFRVPKELGLKSLRFVVRPDGDSPELSQGTSPKRFWLASDQQLFSVTLPHDAWKSPGKAFELRLATELHTECLAIVLESGFNSEKGVNVTFAEVAATTLYSALDLDAIVPLLSSENTDAKSAAARLRLGGDAAFQALVAGYATLSSSGKALALDVIDEAPCTLAASLYVSALLSADEGLVHHAEARLPRCARAAALDIVPRLEHKSLPSSERAALVRALARLAPEVAAKTIPPLLLAAKKRDKALYREALLSAAGASVAEATISAELTDAATPLELQFEILRAIAPVAMRYRDAAGAAFTRLVSAPLGFQRHYLLLDVAAKLAAATPVARQFVGATLQHNPSPYLRAEAARKASPELFAAELREIIDDPQVRVREAAIDTVASEAGFAGDVLLPRLSSDSWPLVRAAAARGLAQARPSRAVDEALAYALRDESKVVRRPALFALGRRKALAQSSPVRRVLDNAGEDPFVRAAAASALGNMCDREALTLLTEYALMLTLPRIQEQEFVIGRAAALALGMLSPPDLADRLQPLTAKNAPAPARTAAREALTKRGSCGKHSR